MKTIKLFPLAGINTEQEDAALKVEGDFPRLFLRDAVNVDISPAGRPQMRQGARKVAGLALDNLWVSPLHGDVFATLGDQWVLVDPSDWTVRVLAEVGEGDISHLVLNNRVCVAAPAGIFVYDGQAASPLAISEPAAPWLETVEGSMAPGRYGFAVAWRRGDVESPCSGIAHAVVGYGEGVRLTLPACYDPLVTQVRIYMTRTDGGELLRVGDYPVATSSVALPTVPKAGAAPLFWHKSAMPSGRFLSYWRGRLLTARANVLRFSEPLAYHVHDERHGFVQMPQRITFVAPVEGGIWVGQVDHVAFLRGAELGGLELVPRSGRAPVPGSAIYLDADAAGQTDQGGMPVVVWLADNGYVLGTSEGQLIESRAGILAGITARQGSSVVLGDRLLTVAI